MKRAVRRLTDVLRRVFLEEVGPLHGDDFLIRPTPAEVGLRTLPGLSTRARQTLPQDYFRVVRHPRVFFVIGSPISATPTSNIWLRFFVSANRSQSLVESIKASLSSHLVGWRPPELAYAFWFGVSISFHR
jgi:hypothetical protein